MDKNSKRRSLSMGDTASVLTILTGSLYILGVTYWSSFYRFFGITETASYLDVQTVLGTTWPVAAFVLAFAIFFFLDIAQDIRETAEIDIATVITLICVSGYLVLRIINFSNKVAWLFVLVAILVGGQLIRNKKTQSVSVRAISKVRWRNRFVFVLLAFFFVVFLYSQLGKKTARTLAKGQTGSLVTVNLKSGLKPIEGAVLIGHLGRQFFLVKPGFDPSVDSVFVIPEDNVLSMKLSPAE